MFHDRSRSQTLRIAISAAALAASAFSPVLGDETGFAGPSDPWTAVAASGPVHARGTTDGQEDWARVRRGDELQPLSDVRTGRKGRATLVLARHILLVRPESELTLPHLEDLNDDSQVYQENGQVTYEIDGSKVERFEVVTPFLIAGVKGTVFTVTVRADGASVSVSEGIVGIRSRLNDDEVELVAGQEARIRAGDARQEIEVGDIDPVKSDHFRQELRMAKRWANLVSALRPRDSVEDSPDTAETVAWSSDLGFLEERDRWRARTSDTREDLTGETLLGEEKLPDQSDLRILALEESVTTWIEDSRTGTRTTQPD